MTKLFIPSFINLKALLKILYKLIFCQWVIPLPGHTVTEEVKQCNTHCVWKWVVLEFLQVLGSVSLGALVHLTAQGTDRDWNAVKSLGRFQDQSLTLAGDAGEGFLLLQHYSHRCHLDNNHPKKEKACKIKGAIVILKKWEDYELILGRGFSAKNP